MYKLAYISRAAPDLSEEGVQEIVAQAGRRNAEIGVTGFLCLRDGVFLQYLEGPEREVLELFDKIRADTRHEMIKSACLGRQTDRNFSSWSMRYLDSHYFGQLAIEDLLEGALLEFGRGTIDPTRAHAMADRLIARIAAASN